MLTSEGAALLWSIITGASTDQISALRVTDGITSATAELDEPARADENALILVATFGDGDANFEWRERLVISRDGVVVDREAQDLGRKAQGSEWTLEATLLLDTTPLVD